MKIEQAKDDESLRHLAGIILSGFEAAEKKGISLGNSLDLSQLIGHVRCGKRTEEDDGATNN